MRRAVYYILLILLAFMLQTNVFQAIKLIDATPNLLLIITFCYGFIRGPIDGMLIGFFSGLLLDLFFGTTIGFYALVYTIIGFTNGEVSRIFYTEFIDMPIVLCLINDLVYSLYVYVFSFLLKGVTNFMFYLKGVILPELIYTVVITFIIYKPLRRVNDWLEAREKRSAQKFV